MKLSSIIKTNESLNEDNGDHEFRGDFTSPQTQDVVMEESAVEAVNSITESDSQYKEIDDVDTGIGEAVDAVGQIGELAETVNSGDGTSLSPLEEQAVQTTMESIFRSIGMKYETPTLESLAGSKRRIELFATMESSFQSVVSKLLSVLKNTADRILAFLMNLFRNNFILLKYLKNTEEKVKVINSWDSPSQTEMSESARAMSVAGAADFKSVELMNKTAESLLTMTESAIGIVNSLDFKFDDTNRAIGEETSLSDSLQKNTSVSPYGFGYLPGDKAFIDFPRGEKVFGISRVYESVRSGESFASSAEVLDKIQMSKTLSYALDIINGIKKVDSKKNVIKNFISRIVHYTSQVGTEITGLASKSSRALRDNIQAIRGHREYMNSIIGRFPLEAFKIAKTFIDYVRNSAKQYS